MNTYGNSLAKDLAYKKGSVIIISDFNSLINLRNQIKKQ